MATRRHLLRAVVAALAVAAVPAPAQMTTQLDALARELQARAAHAAQEREVLSGRLASARQLLDALFAGERHETAVFASETRAQLDRLRRELQDEMARAVADVQQRVAAAAHNVSRLARVQANARRAHEQQLAVLRAERLAKAAADEVERQKQLQEAAMELARRQQVVAESARDDAAAGDDQQSHAMKETSATELPFVDKKTSTAGHRLSGGEIRTVEAGVGGWMTQSLAEAWTLVWRWLVPAVLVFGGVLLAVIAVATFVQHRRAKRRTKGVLFSPYLKPRTPQQQQLLLERRRRRPVESVRNAAFPGVNRQVQ